MGFVIGEVGRIGGSAATWHRAVALSALNGLLFALNRKIPTAVD
jgi:hypothetical protein